MAKISVDQNKCIGCGSCEALCPKSFKLVNGKAKPIKSSIDKITCEADAESSCPVGAIKVE